MKSEIVRLHGGAHRVVLDDAQGRVDVEVLAGVAPLAHGFKVGCAIEGVPRMGRSFLR